MTSSSKIIVAIVICLALIATMWYVGSGDVSDAPNAKDEESVNVSRPRTEHDEAVIQKIGNLALACAGYAQRNNGRFPDSLADIGFGGDASIRYRRPPAGSDPMTTVVLYEVYETWPEEGLWVGYADAHRRRIVDEAEFEALTR